jgi:hypothetical protein
MNVKRRDDGRQETDRLKRCNYLDHICKISYMFWMNNRPGLPSFFLSGWLALACSIIPAVSTAAELLIFERAGCPWCQRWNRDVGPVYSNTAEGLRAPLRRIDLDQKSPRDFDLREPVRFTPTFVLVENGSEIGRLTGYINDEAFWGMLANLLTKLDGGKR